MCDRFTRQPTSMCMISCAEDVLLLNLQCLNWSFESMQCVPKQNTEKRRVGCGSAWLNQTEGDVGDDETGTREEAEKMDDAGERFLLASTFSMIYESDKAHIYVYIYIYISCTCMCLIYHVYVCV